MNNIVEMIISWGGLTETLFCRAFTESWRIRKLCACRSLFES